MKYSIYSDKGGIRAYTTVNRKYAIEEAKRRKEIWNENFHVVSMLKGFVPKTIFSTKEELT